MNMNSLESGNVIPLIRAYLNSENEIIGYNPIDAPEIGDNYILIPEDIQNELMNGKATLKEIHERGYSLDDFLVEEYTVQIPKTSPPSVKVLLEKIEGLTQQLEERDDIIQELILKIYGGGESL